jgi:hypothetical protein
VKSALKGVVTPTESYDLTIIPISKDEGYFCLLIESHPLGMPLKATLDLVKKSSCEDNLRLFLKRIRSLNSISSSSN